MYAIVQQDANTPYGLAFFTGKIDLVRYEDGDLNFRLRTSDYIDDAFQFYGYREPSDIVRMIGGEDEYEIVDLNEVR